MLNFTDNELEIIRLTHEEGRISEKLDAIHKANALAYTRERVVREEYYQNQLALSKAWQKASDLHTK